MASFTGQMAVDLATKLGQYDRVSVVAVLYERHLSPRVSDVFFQSRDVGRRQNIMIISASRRTDIPAFYATWFMNRIRAGYCTVPNPFNLNQISYVSLKPHDVDVIVFWTRNPRPLFGAFDELDALGFRYYFQFTILDNPRVMDPKSPPVEASIKTFQALSDRLGPDRVIWRYDPVVLSDETDAAFHSERYAYIASQLCGYTRRSVISIVDVYKKAAKRLRSMAAKGIVVARDDVENWPGFSELMRFMVGEAERNKMELVSCAEELNLSHYGVQPGKCVDDGYIARLFGCQVTSKKDPSQRQACGCVVSRDIGMYDSCLFGCQYCYATSSFERAQVNHVGHDPDSPSLLGHYDVSPEILAKLQTQDQYQDEESPCPPAQLSLPFT